MSTNKEQEFDVRLLDRKGEVHNTRKVHFEEYRLSQYDKQQLKRKTGFMRFADVDPDSLSKIKGDEDKSKVAENIKFLDVRLADMEDASYEANVELAKICFGLNDVSTNRIVAADFEPLIRFIQDKDLLDFKDEKQKAKEAKKKG